MDSEKFAFFGVKYVFDRRGTLPEAKPLGSQPHHALENEFLKKRLSVGT